jgi:hypothetical protein
MRSKKSAEAIVHSYCNNYGRAELIKARNSYITLDNVWRQTKRKSSIFLRTTTSYADYGD